MSHRLIRALSFTLIAAAVSLSAQRWPVLRQIDIPYSVYYREMYLPQLTSGPSSVAWMPDSQTVIFSMQGSLWKQSTSSSTAEQLTDGPGYDYQPDVSPDGRWVIYAKYDQDAIELWLLDLTTRRTRPLTKTAAVNLEPRWAPGFKKGDTRVVFVSTQFNQHFHVFVAQFDPARAELKDVQRLTAETRSTVPRLYDGIYDHEISPAWSPDGKEIIFVANHNRSNGSGLWRMNSTPLLVELPPPIPRGPFGMMARRLPPMVKEESHEIAGQNTIWRSRPDWSPDGKRLVYASYQTASKDGGRYELRTISVDAAQPQVISHSEEGHNDFNPRWSPDGKSIASISTRGGNFSLWVQDAAGLNQREVSLKERKFLAPRAAIRLQGTGPGSATGATVVRVSITGEDGRAYAPDDAIIYAGDSFDRKERPFEVHYFNLNVSRLRPSEAITVPPGKIHLEIAHGLDYLPVNMDVELKAGENKIFPFKLQPLHLPESPTTHWIDGDLHVAMNHGGAYRNTAQTLLTEMKAEDLSVAFNLMANDGAIPVTKAVGMVGPADPLSAWGRHILYGQEFHSGFWGDIDILNISSLDVRRDPSDPKAAASILPTNAEIADRAHTSVKNALVGYTHLFRNLPSPETDTKLTNELPIDVALGKVDYYAPLSQADPQSSAEVWYALLNLGFHIPVAAGSDATAGYASSRGPVGHGRVYVRVPNGPFQLDSWLSGLKRGRSFATNGPLLRFTLGGRQVGGELKLPARKTVRFTATLRSIVPVDHLEVVCNGEVAINVPLNRTRDSSDAVGGVHLGRSGWCLLRAWAEKTEGTVPDDDPYATTSPIYVTVAGARPRSPKDAKYFLKWVDRVRENAEASPGYKNEEQKVKVLKTIDNARAVYEKLAK